MTEYLNASTCRTSCAALVALSVAAPLNASPPSPAPQVRAIQGTCWAVGPASSARIRLAPGATLHPGWRVRCEPGAIATIAWPGTGRDTHVRGGDRPTDGWLLPVTPREPPLPPGQRGGSVSEADAAQPTRGFRHTRATTTTFGETAP